MAISIDCVHHVLQNSVLIDDEGRPNNAHLFLAILFLFLPYTVTITNPASGVSQQNHIEAIFINKCLVAFAGVLAYADDNGIQLGKLAGELGKLPGFNGASRSIVGELLLLP